MTRFIAIISTLGFLVFMYVLGCYTKILMFDLKSKVDVGFSTLEFKIAESESEMETAVYNFIDRKYSNQVYCVFFYKDDEKNEGQVLLVDEQGRQFYARRNVVRDVKRILRKRKKGVKKGVTSIP